MSAFRLRNNVSRCSRCYQRQEICICPVVPTVKTRVEFLILRHIKEVSRASNTGRLVALAMPNSRIVPCGGGTRVGASCITNELLRSGTYLLWPDGPAAAQDITEMAPPDRVVVLDATWRQARSLYHRTPVLRAIPRLVLPVPARSRDRLREQHRRDGMSTIEAVAAAVRRLEGDESAEPLEKLYDEVVRRTTALRWGNKPEN